MALLNKNHLRSLVAVGSIEPKGGGFVCDSTSFLVGFLFKDSDNPQERLYQLNKPSAYFIKFERYSRLDDMEVTIILNFG